MRVPTAILRIVEMLKRIHRFFFGIPYDERSDVLCGDKADHYEFTDAGMSCPHCLAIKLAARKNDIQKVEDDKRMSEYEILAELIATKVVEKMKNG